jgi:hypothetical protein
MMRLNSKDGLIIRHVMTVFADGIRDRLTYEEWAAVVAGPDSPDYPEVFEKLKGLLRGLLLVTDPPQTDWNKSVCPKEIISEGFEGRLVRPLKGERNDCGI